jgi:CubicO group peptidase (beta-lactamase class C family)
MRKPRVLPVLAASLAFADPIDAVVRKEMARSKVPGMAVAVVRDGKLVTKRAYGLADLELGAKMQPDDLFELGSVTKQFTAFLSMLLVEDGKLDLDAPISTYLDALPEAWKSIKVRNLLNQNSGLPEYVQLPGIGLADEFDREKWFATVTKVPLDFPPGTAWAYSNTNYALMGFIIEKVGGKPYTEQLTERVLKPLGMTQTRFQDINQIWPRRAHGIIRQPDGTAIRVPGMGGSIQSDGTLVSNLTDMVKWDAALRERKLLKPEGYAQIWAPGRLADGLAKPYGMGWFLTGPDSPPYVGHAGASVGYGGGIARYRDGQKGSISVIVLSNQYAVPGEEIGKRIAEALDPSLKIPILATATDPNPERTARLKAIIDRLAANKPQPGDLDPAVAGPISSWRAQQFPPFRGLANIKEMAFAREDRIDGFTRLAYRLKTERGGTTAYFTLTPDGKLAAVQTRPDPQ